MPKKSSKHRKGSAKNRIGKRGAVRRAPQITTAIRTRHWNFPQLPTEMNLKLRYVLNTTVIATVTPYTNYFGLFEYLNRKPLYSAQMFSLYKKARVAGVNITIQVMNSGTNPIFGALAGLTYVDSVSWGPTQAEEFPGGIYKVAAGAQGISKITIKKSFDSKRVLGNQISSDHTTWMDAASASNTTPLDNEDPIIACIFGPVDGSTSSNYTISFKVDYNVIYFDRTLPGLSVQRENINKGVFVNTADYLEGNSSVDEIADEELFEEPQKDDSLKSFKKIQLPIKNELSLATPLGLKRK